MTTDWIELNENSLPPSETLVWIERYTVSARGVHHEIYLGARIEGPLSKNQDPSENCMWHSRRMDDLCCDPREGFKLTTHWSDVTVKRWSLITPPELPSK